MRALVDARVLVLACLSMLAVLSECDGPARRTVAGDRPRIGVELRPQAAHAQAGITSHQLADHRPDPMWLDRRPDP